MSELDVGFAVGGSSLDSTRLVTLEISYNMRASGNANSLFLGDPYISLLGV